MIDTRLSKLKKLLSEKNIDSALISSLQNIIYLTNFSYFTDIEREAFLLVTKKNQYIFADGRYTHAVKKYVKDFQLRELKASEPLSDHLKNIFAEERITVLGIEEDNITIKEQQKIAPVTKQQQHFTLRSLRIQKEPDEIKKIKKACTIGDKIFSYIVKKIQVGMTEKEIAFLLETFIRRNGAEPSFPTIVAFGANAAVPHHKTGKQKLKLNQFVLLDFGVKYDNYCSDMTRTIFLGTANKEQKKAYQSVKVAQQKAIEYIEKQLQTKQSVKASETDNAARSYLISKGFPSFPHSLGHGIGLEVHEAPFLSPQSEYLLNEGMVFSIEPGIYINDKFGIRIEDLFAIQKGKLVKLTKSQRSFIEI